MGGRVKAAHSERTKSGMVMAMERGAKPGQPCKLNDAQWVEVEQLLAQGISPADIADKFQISRQTLYFCSKNGCTVLSTQGLWLDRAAAHDLLGLGSEDGRRRHDPERANADAANGGPTSDLSRASHLCALPHAVADLVSAGNFVTARALFDPESDVEQSER
jgi:hypothetical protein